MYFSFVKMDATVVVPHFDFPAGVWMPSAVRALAMRYGVFPAIKRAKMTM